MRCGVRTLVSVVLRAVTGGRVLRKAQNLRTQLQLPATESTSYKAYMQQQLETISSQDEMTETGTEVGTVLKSGRRYGGDCLVQFDSGSRIWAAPEELHVTAFGDRRLMPDDRPADPTGFLAKMTPMSNAFSTNDDFASTDLGAEPEQASSARDGNGTVASRLFKRMEFVDGENRLTAEEDERYRARRLQSQQQRLLVLQKMSTGSWDAKKVRESIAALKMDINRLKGNKNSSQEFTISPSNAEAAKGEHGDENRAGCWPRVRVAANMRQLHTKIRHQRRPSVVNMVSDLVDEKRGTVKPSNLVHALRFSQKLTETKAWAKMTSECRLGKIIRSPNGTFCACFSANAAKVSLRTLL